MKCKCGAERVKCGQCGNHWCSNCRKHCICHEPAVPINKKDELLTAAIDTAFAGLPKVMPVIATSVDETDYLTVMEENQKLLEELALYKNMEARSITVDCPSCNRPVSVETTPTDMEYWSSQIGKTLFPTSFSVGQYVRYMNMDCRIVSVQTSLAESGLYSVHYILLSTKTNRKEIATEDKLLIEQQRRLEENKNGDDGQK